MADDPKFLLVQMFDAVPATREDEVNRWYDADRVPQQLSRDGFRSCDRYQATPQKPAGWTAELQLPRFLNVYELQSPEASAPAWDAAIDVEAGQGIRSISAAWKRRASPWRRRTTVSLPPPHVLYLVLRDVEPEKDAAFNACLDDEFVAEMTSIPGFLGCERYEAIKPAQESTGDRQARYLELYEVATPEVLTSGAFHAFIASPSVRMRELGHAMAVYGTGLYLQRPSPWLVSFSGH